MKFISANLKMLKNLHVKNILIEAFVEVKIPGLKSITFDKLVHSQDSWLQIVKAFPNIEELKMKITFESLMLDKICAKIITKGLPKLKYVELTVGLPFQDPIQPIIDHFIQNCKELVQLEFDGKIIFPNQF